MSVVVSVNTKRNSANAESATWFTPATARAGSLKSARR